MNAGLQASKILRPLWYRLFNNNTSIVTVTSPHIHWLQRNAFVLM